MAQALNTRTQKVLAAQVEFARNMFTRMLGLMGRPQLSEGSAMLISPSGNSIHTFFMKFPIDLVFIDSTGKVRFLKENVNPWKVVFAPVMGRTDCLELPSGTIARTETQMGDVIRVES